MASVPVFSTLTGQTVRRWFGVEGALILVLRVALWPVRMLRARCEFGKLAALSERELRDIGLTPHDLRNATALPLDEDPTRFLASVVAERRWAERARSRGPVGTI